MTKIFYFNRKNNQLTPITKDEYEALIFEEMYRSFYAKAEIDPEYY